jgi:hypothetical protein
MEVASNNIRTDLTSSLDLRAPLSKEQSLPPKLGQEHVAVHVVSIIVHSGSLFPEGSV